MSFQILTAPLPKPFRAPYEPIAVMLEAGKFIFNPKMATKLCLPAPLAAQWWSAKLPSWGRMYAKDGCNPWQPISNKGYHLEPLMPGFCRNSETAAYFHRIPADKYDANNTFESGDSMNFYNITHDKTAHKFTFEFYLDNDLEENKPNSHL